MPASSRLCRYRSVKSTFPITITDAGATLGILRILGFGFGGLMLLGLSLLEKEDASLTCALLGLRMPPPQLRGLKGEQNCIDLHPSIGDKRDSIQIRKHEQPRAALRYTTVMRCTAVQRTLIVAPEEKGEITHEGTHHFNIGFEHRRPDKTVKVSN